MSYKINVAEVKHRFSVTDHLSDDFIDAVSLYIKFSTGIHGSLKM